MEKLSSSVLIFVFTIIPSVLGAVVEPFLSLPGNQTKIAFLDLHRRYDGNGSCSYPDWRLFEVALSLEWMTVTEQNTGLEIYDTCGSRDHALLILRDVVLLDGCLDKDSQDILGVLSYTSMDTSRLINATVRLKDIPFVDVRNLAMTEARKRIISSLMPVLKQANWTYITTATDNSELSISEYAAFLRLAKENDICVQYSMSENGSGITLTDIKTPGVVIFTSELLAAEQLLLDLPPKHGAIIITHDRNEWSMNATSKMLMLSDGFLQIGNFSDFVVEALSNRINVSNGTNSSERFKNYFVTRHGCTWNDTSDEFGCANTPAVRDYFMRRSSEFDIHTALSAIDFLLLESQTPSMETTTRDHVTLSSIANGGITKSVSFSANDSVNSDQILSQLLNTASFHFPKSRCEGWCPSCTACTGHVPYDGDYRYFPGDIVVAGLFPMREKADTVFQCGSVAFNEFSDIYAAAFQFALQSAQTRSPGLLPNVTIGGLIFDTCSDTELTSKTLLNFESCLYSFAYSTNDWSPNPQIVPGYIIPQYASTVAMETFVNLKKIGIGILQTGAVSLNSRTVYEPSRFNYSALVQVLKKMNWTYVGIVTSTEFDKHTLDGFLENTIARNICIAYRTEISTTNGSSINEAINKIKLHPAGAVIFFARSNAIRDFFRTLTYKPLNRVWILLETRDDYLGNISPPPGSIIFQKKGKQNTEFNQHYTTTPIEKPWEDIFKQARDACISPACKRDIASPDTWMRASDIIKSVDIVLHSFHDAYVELCPALEGLCPQFLDHGARLAMDKANNVEFEYQGEPIRLNDTDIVFDAYTISNVQTNGRVQIGSWSTEGLDLDKDIIKFYTVDGIPIQRNFDSYCSSRCSCINNYTVENSTEKFEAIELDPETGYVDSSAEFDRDLWSIIVTIIALSGCVITLGMMMYISCKVCAGALIRRYLVLGVLLLVAMLILFLSVLPFVFTPSEVGCGMRFFAHGFSYAFCYAVMLTKMTSLRDYKYIGLGGEISRLNQILSVFFITGVQIAIGVQWWVLGESTFIQTTIKKRLNGEIQNTTYYACDFERNSFIAYHSYVMLLLVMCCLYSICVRKETKNMKEARLLLVCSWFCLALWIALVVTFLVLQRDYLEPIAAIGLLANALSIMVIVYFPKLTFIARLKYDISEKDGKPMENGYKIDTDFQFERPYSLPGTMHSTFTDKSTTLPRSLAAFDSSLSY